MTFLAFVTFLLAVWLVFRSRADRRRLNQLQAELNLVQVRLIRLDRPADSVPAETPDAVPQIFTPAVAVSVPPPLPPLRLPVSPRPVPSAPVAPAPAPPARPSLADRVATALPRIDWEQFVGVKLFAWLGGLALFIAAVLGLKYSFDHDLIPPEVRAAGGFLLGVGLVAGGLRLHRKAYLVTAQTLLASGIVILYATTFACRGFYHFAFFTTGPTFALMALITGTAFLLAVRLDAPVVAILGMLGGFLTPPLLSSGVDNPAGLFGYVALLDLGLLAVAHRKRWDYLALLAAVGTVLTEFAWHGRFFLPEKVYIAQAVFLGLATLFLGAFAWACRRGWNSRLLTAAILVVAGAALLESFTLVTGASLRSHPGRGFTVAFGADLILLAAVVLRPRLARVETVSGLVLFLLLSLWTFLGLDAGLMYWALGLYLAFAVLHSAFPLLLRAWKPAETPPPAWWTQFVPAVALILALLPVALDLTVPWLFWIVVGIVDVLAVGLALLAGSVLGLVAVLVLTVAATAVWLTHSAAHAVDLSESIVVIGGFAVFFFAASGFLWRRLLPSLAASGGRPGRWDLFRTGATPGPALPGFAVPALSAALPFLLLVMAVAQFRPADPSAVFGLTLLLGVLLLGLARLAGLASLVPVALAGTWLVQAAWVGTSLDARTSGATGPLLWLVGFHFLFAAFPFVFARQFRDRTVAWAAAALSGPVQFGLVYRVVSVLFPAPAFPSQAMGLLPALFALPALVGLVILARRLAADSPRRLAILAWQGGVALFFITLVFPIQFDREWITLAWALEGAALCWLFHRLPHPGLRVVGVALLLVAFGRLTLNPAVLSYHPRSATPILNWYLYTYLTAAGCLFAGAQLLAPPRDRLFGSSVPPILRALGTVLLFLLVNLEIADYFSTGSTLTFEFSGNFARDLAYTVAWALFALALVSIGLGRRARFVRYTGLGLLGVTLGKLFLHDLAHLNQLYRIAAFAAVAVIAILASFLYQRFLAHEDAAPSTSSQP